MKKKSIIILSALAMVVLLYFVFTEVKLEKIVYEDETTSAPIKKLSNNELLRQVINGEREFINSDGKEILVSDLQIEDTNVKIKSYALVDLDDNKINELVAKTTAFEDTYLILKNENKVIYGYTLKEEACPYINSKGICKNNETYSRITFNKNEVKMEEEATIKDNISYVNHKTVDYSDYQKYEEEYVSTKQLNFRFLNLNLVEESLTEKYNFSKNKVYESKLENIDFVFMNDKKFESFNTDFKDNKFSLYYKSSNEHMGKVYINDTSLDFSELNDNKAIGLFDCNTNLIAIVINNDKFSTNLDDNKTIYYFKYYNKGIQYVGLKENMEEINNIFSDEIINEFTNSKE